MNPFTTDPGKSISFLGESVLIENIRKWLGDVSPPEPAGIGDDCAVIEASGTHLVTTDPVIYGKHFDDSLSPQQTAAKLARRNLSDIAAMGGQPLYATIALAIAPNVSVDWIRDFYLSLAQEARAYEFKIVGGDISSADNFLGSFMTLVGQTIDKQHPLLRHRASIGSHIYVTGELGGTRHSKHYSFTPRIPEGQWLSKHGEVETCCDLSDGLGKDFKNLLAPGSAMKLDCSKIPLSEDALLSSKDSGETSLYHAINDGEDFEPLFSIAPNAYLPAIESSWAKEFDTKLTRIGTVVEMPANTTAQERLILENRPDDLKATGYEHLR